MTHGILFAASALASALGLAPIAAVAEASPAPADAEAFIERVNADLREIAENNARAAWLASTYINEDSRFLSSRASERYLTYFKQTVEEATRYEGLTLEPETARAIGLLKLGTAMPAPDDPDELRELTQISSRMEAAYGSGQYCPDGEDSCRNLGDLSEVLADPDEHGYDTLLEAWTGWRTISPPMREDYARFVELTNAGARSLGYGDLAEMWQSGYDMPAAEFQTEIDRLWGQVEPLYEDLHCYVRAKLHERYGDKVPADGPIPAHLLGNMWAQDWTNIYALVEPYPGVGGLDVGKVLEARRDEKRRELLSGLGEDAGIERQAEKLRQADAWIAREMVESAESFYTSMGIRKLPESFWKKSMFTRPRDRDVVCHASAWDMDMEGDVRIKMCIRPTEEDLTTVYHELGHLYYDLAYNPLPPLFQNGAHDGFHEAIGDTIVLAMTPGYMAEAGLIESAGDSREAVLNRQMRMALGKVAFLPFGRMIDEWRWRVFSGDIGTDEYNREWWELREKYQGVAAPVERGEEHFDPGAKYHIPANTPYTRYFLAHVLQFQFYQAMCEVAGHEGPLYQCSFFGSEEAGERFWAMLEQGARQPWPRTLAELTDGQKMDAAALNEYFRPLKEWLGERNSDRTCGWRDS